jgi:hypothetical protein
MEGKQKDDMKIEILDVDLNKYPNRFTITVKISVNRFLRKQKHEILQLVYVDGTPIRSCDYKVEKRQELLEVITNFIRVQMAHDDRLRGSHGIAESHSIADSPHASDAGRQQLVNDMFNKLAQRQISQQHFNNLMGQQMNVSQAAGTFLNPGK